MAGRFDAVTRAAIARVAEREGLPPAALMAVVEVESGGRVFARVRGRREPLIRFEGHYFDRLLDGAKRERARADGLANPRAGRVRNPRGQAARWTLLDRAIAIDRTAALSSCSWGVGQVMGSHWRWLGFGSVDAMVARARDGLEGQVALMVAFIERSDLRDALIGADFERFARVYNGPAYARHGYHTRMARAHARFERLTAAAPAGAADGLRFGARGEAVRRLQAALRALGHPITIDGIYGAVTDREVRAFQRAHALPATGIADLATRAAIARFARVGDPMAGFARRLRCAVHRPGRMLRRLSLSLR